MSIKIIGIEPQTACGILQMRGKFYQFNYPYDAILDLEEILESDLFYLSYFKLLKLKPDLPSTAIYLANKYERLKSETIDEYNKPRHLENVENIFSKVNNTMSSRSFARVSKKNRQLNSHSKYRKRALISKRKLPNLLKEIIEPTIK